MTIFRSILALAALIGATACQSTGSSNETSMSIKEAKKVTAEFSETTFVAPPHSITDITAILDRQKLADQSKLARLIAEADKPRPATNNSGDLARFYFSRAKSANELSRGKQTLNDYREAIIFARESGSWTILRRSLFNLGTALFTYGNFSDGIEKLRESRTFASNPGQELHALLLTAAATAEIGGDFETAQGILEEAAPHLEETENWDDPMSVASVRSNNDHAWAMLHWARGELLEAESRIRLAIDLWSPYKDSSFGDQTLRFLPQLIFNWYIRNYARILHSQGRYVEAEAQARKALVDSLSLFGTFSYRTAENVNLLGSSLFGQGRYLEAEQVARRSVEIFEASGSRRDSVTRARAKNNLGRTLLMQGNWKLALKTFREIEKGFDFNIVAYPTFLVHNIERVMAYFYAGELKQAQKIVTVMLKHNRLVLGDSHDETAIIHGVLGAIHFRKGNLAAAFKSFQNAVPVLLEGLADTSPVNSPKEQHLKLILESYIEFLIRAKNAAPDLLAGLDPLSESFRAAARLRGRKVQHALSAAAARSAITDPALAALVRREQDTEWRINGVSAAISALASEATYDKEKVARFQQEISQLRVAKRTLRAEITKQFPEYAELINPNPLSVEKARGYLYVNEALITTYVGVNRAYVWAVPKVGEPAFATVKLHPDEIVDHIDRLRDALDPQNVSTLNDIPAFDVDVAFELFQKLLKPVEDGWSNAKSLIVVSDGPLGILPFSLLPTKETADFSGKTPLFSDYKSVSWLARTHAVTALPSVASLNALRALPRRGRFSRNFVGFGDSLFNEQQVAESQSEKPAKLSDLSSRRGKRSGSLLLRAAPNQRQNIAADIASLPRLRDTAYEVLAIAKALNANVETDVFLGKRANEEQVKEMDLTGTRVIAFATHGLIPGDFDGLHQPALALTPSAVTGRSEDGLLTMGEILTLKLNADWVVLSACNTASGDGAGAEAVSGLGRAFFYAGSRALLVTNWPVETTSARALTTDLFERQSSQPNLTRAEALRQTMLGLIDGKGFVDQVSKKVVFSYAHPIFWAPFTIVGDGGGAKAGL